MTISLAAPIIYSIKFLVFHFLGAEFIAARSGHYQENQLVLGSKRLLQQAMSRLKSNAKVSPLNSSFFLVLFSFNHLLLKINAEILKITTATTETVLYEFIDEVIDNEDKLAETIT